MTRLLLFSLMLLGLTGCAAKDWRTASREPAGIAPNPAMTREAIIQVFGARTWGWRGWFAIHTWIATKPTNEASYTIYEVIGTTTISGIQAELNVIRANVAAKFRKVLTPAQLLILKTLHQNHQNTTTDATSS